MKIYIDLNKFRTVKGESNDCSVTALATATGVGYTKAWQVLRDLGRRKQEGASRAQLRKAATSLGFSPTDWQPAKPITLAKFIKIHKRGRFIAYTRDHAVSVVDGKMFDANMTHGKTFIYGFISLEDI
jgi:hypothetical protein